MRSLHPAHRRCLAAALVAVAAVAAACTADPGPQPPANSSPTVADTRGTSDDADPTATAGSVHSPTVAPSSGQTVVTDTTGADEGPAVPAVVELAWLSGPADDGVQIVVGDDIHWQGTVPGEHARITGDAYQWFGADGSMVGCSAPGKCLGIDADGFVAVLTARGTRSVYSPQGDPVGLFSADGQQVAGKQSKRSKAVTGSGVDLAGLLDAATTQLPFAGGVTGDPHLITVGGQRYSSQLTGEYHARTGDPARQVQIRLEPLPRQADVSVVTAAAISINGSILEYHSDGSASLDRQVLPTPDPFRQLSVAGGPELGLWAADAAGTMHAAVVWPDESVVLLAANPDLGMTIALQAPDTPGVSGLFGVGGSDPANDLQDRQGAALDTDTVVRAWAASADESLFADRVEPTVGFPGSTVQPPAAAAAFADQACRGAGVVGEADLAACGFDVGLTGDAGFAVGHAALATVADRVVAASATDGWPAMVLQVGAVAELPELIDTSLEPGEQRAYQLQLDRRGPIGLEFLHGCGADLDAFPARTDGAVRLFDRAGVAVSPRMYLCGQPETPVLAPGRYTLAIAAPTGDEGLDVRVEVKVP